VSNLRDAPVGSIGGNLRFGRSHFVSTVLLIGGGTSMRRQNARDTLREAEGRAITWGYLAHMHPFKTLNKAFTLPRERLKHPCRY
jgi:hypothetical protein